MATEILIPRNALHRAALTAISSALADETIPSFSAQYALVAKIIARAELELMRLHMEEDFLLRRQLAAEASTALAIDEITSYEVIET